MGCRLVLNSSRHRPAGSGRIAPNRGRDPQSLRIEPLHGPITAPDKAKSRSLERTRAACNPPFPYETADTLNLFARRGTPSRVSEKKQAHPARAGSFVTRPRRSRNLLVYHTIQDANTRTGVGQGRPFRVKPALDDDQYRSLDEAKRNPGEGPGQASSPNSGLCPHPSHPVIPPRCGELFRDGSRRKPRSPQLRPQISLCGPGSGRRRD